jgi:phage/plasmid primase-like uncharacterized protein
MFDALDKKRTTYSTCPICQQKNALAITRTDGQPLVHCFYECPQDSVWRALRDGGLPTKPPEPKTRQRVNSDSTRAFALELWQKSQPAKDTLVPVYLTSRAIIGVIPDALRGMAHCWHKPSGVSYPAMITAVTDWQGRIHAIHRTYLAPDGKGKAPVTPAKMTLGQVGGLSCHLASARDELAVTEGIETGLSVQFSTGIPTWSALSAGGIRNLILPPLPLASIVTICADNDPVGIRSAQEAAHRWIKEGRCVKIALPPEGKDFNDILMGAMQ